MMRLLVLSRLLVLVRPWVLVLPLMLDHPLILGRKLVLVRPSMLDWALVLVLLMLPGLLGPPPVLMLPDLPGCRRLRGGLWGGMG